MSVVWNVAADAPLGHWGRRIMGKGGRGKRQELLIAARELQPSK